MNLGPLDNMRVGDQFEDEYETGQNNFSIEVKLIIEFYIHGLSFNHSIQNKICGQILKCLVSNLSKIMDFNLPFLPQFLDSNDNTKRQTIPSWGITSHLILMQRRTPSWTKLRRKESKSHYMIRIIYDYLTHN